MVATGFRVFKNTVGDSDNFSECENIVRENRLENRVKLLPNLPQKDLQVLLNTVDLVVSPNIHYQGSSEGFGINVIEAAACERVVVASALQGLSYAIENGKNGFLIEPENTEQWVKKIKEIFAAGVEFRQSFGKMAAEFVRENFTWEKISKNYFDEITKA
jgi:phosphatidylinositol alpha-1,6-mannosyltransferase